MNPKLIKIVYRSVARRAAYRALVGRNRDRAHPGKGRFTRKEVNDILREVWEVYDQLAPAVPREPKIGNRMNMLLSCVTLACFRVMTNDGMDRAYSIELIGDMAWKIYEVWGRVPFAVARLMVRDPRARMRMSVNMFLRFPFTPPGYVFERVTSEDGISLDMLRCPVAEYFQKELAADLCAGTWCNLDFALAEMWGGSLERGETLAMGCARCDFRFKAPAPGSDGNSDAKVN